MFSKMTTFENVFAIVCGIGLLTHVFVISRRYFSYETSTKVIIDTDCGIKVPTLSFCVRYMDLMDPLVLQRKFNITLTDSTTTFDKYFGQTGKLTVADILSLTPSGRQVVINCMMRPVNQNRRVIHSRTRQEDCFSLFDIQKFYMQSFVCYRFRPTNQSEDLTMDELSHSYNYEFVIYALRLMESLAHTEYAFLILSYDSFPFLSRSFGSLRKTRVTEDSEQRPNSYIVQHKVTDIQLQAPPYDTNCDPDYDPSFKSECIIRLMQTRGLNRVPNTEIVTRPYDLPHVQHNDDDNRTFRAIADQIYAECEAKYYRNRCSYRIAETAVRMEGEEKKEKSLRIRVMGPRGPNTHIQSEPGFPLSEYLLYVFSCFGIWFGISVNRFNPIPLFAFFTQRHLKRRTAKCGPMSRGPDIKSVIGNRKETLVEPIREAKTRTANSLVKQETQTRK